jgi:hypothetical protein
MFRSLSAEAAQQAAAEVEAMAALAEKVPPGGQPELTEVATAYGRLEAETDRLKTVLVALREQALARLKAKGPDISPAMPP